MLDRNFVSRRFWILLGLMWGIASSLSLQAQPSDRYSQIPGDSLVVYSIDVESIVQLKELELMPWEIYSALGKQELGIDPMLISTIDFHSGMPGPGGPEFGVVIKTKAPVNLKDLSDKIFGEVTTSPKNKEMTFRLVNNAPVKVVQTESKTLLVGTDGTLRRMLGGKVKQGKGTELLSKSKYPIRSVFMIEPLRPLISGALSDAPGIPPQLQDDLQTVVEELEYILTGSTVSLSADISLVLGTKDKESSTKLLAALNRLRSEGLELAETLITQQIQNEREMSAELKVAALEYMQRLKGFLQKADLWEVSGNEIKLNATMTYSIPTIGVLTGLLLPAVQSAREAARRMQSQNNIRQLGLALLNYESAYRKFPPRASMDTQDKPLLSWRVAILPYVEQQALYNEFHLDEPWDSDHNINLLDRMPAVFKHPNYAGPGGNTVYVAPYLEGSVWTRQDPRLRDILDGTSNTIALLEVDDANAVPWTKPEDLDIDEKDLMECIRKPVMSVLLFDCSARVISEFIDPEILEAMITSNGGEPIP